MTPKGEACRGFMGSSRCIWAFVGVECPRAGDAGVSESRSTRGPTVHACPAEMLSSSILSACSSRYIAMLHILAQGLERPLRAAVFASMRPSVMYFLLVCLWTCATAVHAFSARSLTSITHQRLVHQEPRSNCPKGHVSSATHQLEVVRFIR